jgi:hypothetical protein
MKIINNILLVSFFFSATAGIFAEQEMFIGFDQAGVDFVEGMENLTIQLMSSTVEEQGDKLDTNTVGQEALTENTMQTSAATGQQVPGAFNLAEKSPTFSNTHSQCSSFEKNNTNEDSSEEMVVFEQKKQKNKSSLLNSNSVSTLIGIGMVIQAIIILNKIFPQGERGNGLHCQR